MLTTTQVAAALGVTRQLVGRFILTGRIRANRHGPIWAVTPEELSRFKALPRLTGRRGKDLRTRKKYMRKQIKGLDAGK